MKDHATREDNEINDIIDSLECNLEVSEATNDSLRQLINTSISNSKPNEISPSNVPTMRNNQCLPSHVEQTNVVPPKKTSHVDQQKKVIRMQRN